MKTHIVLLSLVVIMGCSSPKEKIPDMPSLTSKAKKPIVYQMMTRLFGNKNTTNKPYGTLDENGVGKFADINEKALQGIKDLGVTHVWYTGVLEHAVLTDYTKFGIPLDDADVVKGRAGSPYAIKDYYDVNPDLAVDVKNRLAEFDQLIERTHQAGLKVVIDFVPNHVARSYHSDAKPEGVKDLGEEDDKNAGFKPSNNFYYLPGQKFTPPQDYNSLGNNTFPTKDRKFDEVPAKATGNDQFTATPSIHDWFETIKLNYGVDIQGGRKNHFDPVPETWNKMRDILVYWAKRKVDGFRCDMAQMVPVEFWGWVIPQVKQVNSQIIFIAEIYSPELYRPYIETGKFDYLYDKVQLYDTLRMLVNHKTQAKDIAAIQTHLKGINANMLHFLENHDEQRIASPFFATDPWRAVPAMTVSALIDQGPMMIYFGQEVGEKAEGAAGFQQNDGRTTMFDYWGVPAHQKWMNDGKFDGGALTDEQKQLRQFYGDILNFASSNPAIASGEYLDVTEFNFQKGSLSPFIHAFVRYAGEEKLLIVTNFSDKLEKAKIQLSEESVKSLQLDLTLKYIGRDLLRSGLDIGFDQNFYTEFDMPAYSAVILKIKN
jgi:glycosidase